MACWLKNESIHDVISVSWNELAPSNVDPMVRMMIKLKRLKNILKNWNWSIFEDVNRSVATVQQNLESVQREIQHRDFTEELHNQEVEALASLQGPGSFLQRKIRFPMARVG